MKRTADTQELSRAQHVEPNAFRPTFEAYIIVVMGQTSCIESKMVQSKLVRATATSHVFKLSTRAVLCCSSELSVKGF